MAKEKVDCIDAILAYHEKVRGQLQRLRDIEANLEIRDADSLYEAAELCADVLRTLGAEMALHERDEGESLFPRLAEALAESGTSEPELERELAEAVREHADAEALWRFLRHWLWMIMTPDAIVSLDRFREACDAVDTHLSEHMAQEERLIFPAARRLLSDEQLSTIADEMRNRRS